MKADTLAQLVLDAAARGMPPYFYERDRTMPVTALEATLAYELRNALKRLEPQPKP